MKIKNYILIITGTMDSSWCCCKEANFTFTYFSEVLQSTITCGPSSFTSLNWCRLYQQTWNKTQCSTSKFTIISRIIRSWFVYLFSEVFENCLIFNINQFLDTSETGIKNSIRNGEQYLIKVLKKTRQSLTFDDLRYWIYHYGSQFLITELPPTSASIHLHILRSFIATHKQINL